MQSYTFPLILILRTFINFLYYLCSFFFLVLCFSGHLPLSFFFLLVCSFLLIMDPWESLALLGRCFPQSNLATVAKKDREEERLQLLYNFITVEA